MESPEPRAPDIAGPGRGDPALVVFADESGLKCLRCLRRGFRHCFIAVRSARGWVVCDPLSHQTDLSIVDGFSPPELAAWYREYGLVVVETHLRPAPLRPAPLRPFTCVEMVKRVLGLHAPWVLRDIMCGRGGGPSPATLAAVSAAAGSGRRGDRVERRADVFASTVPRPSH